MDEGLREQQCCRAIRNIIKVVGEFKYHSCLHEKAYEFATRRP